MRINWEASLISNEISHNFYHLSFYCNFLQVFTSYTYELISDTIEDGGK